LIKTVSSLVALVSLTLSSMACDFGDPGPGTEIGLSVESNGKVLVAFNPCSPASVRLVRILQVRGRVFGDSDDELLWEIRSAEPSQLTIFISGETSPGFEENVRLLRGLEGRLAVQILTDRSDRPAGRSFSVDELEVGKYRDVRGQFWVLEDFMQLAACDL
jgi:hypothetical protein